MVYPNADNEILDILKCNVAIHIYFVTLNCGENEKSYVSHNLEDMLIIPLLKMRTVYFRDKKSPFKKLVNYGK